MIRRTLAAATCLLLSGSPSSLAADSSKPPEALAPIPSFTEEAQQADVTHVYDGAWEFFVGGGTAIFDCNDDRRPDLFLAGGSNQARLFQNESITAGPLKFKEVDTGVSDRSLGRVLGAYPIDIDNDDHLDLVVLRLGENLLLKGLGDCRFEVMNRSLAFEGGREWTTAFSATWEEGSTYPTLAFGNYVDRSAPGSPWGTCHNNFLFRPDADSEALLYREPTRLSPGYCSLSILFTDWNRSGEASLRISNDRHYYRGGQEQLWAVPANRPPRPYRRSDGWQHLKIWGMGIASIDLNVDGFPEYALTSMGDTKLQTLDLESDDTLPVFEDIAFNLGVTAHRPYTGDDLKPSTGWHSEFQDVNNDGLWDLFIAKGNVEAMPDFAAYDPDNLLLGQWSRTFAEAGKDAGIALDRRGRGGGLADFNADGLLDLIVVNRSSPVSLFRNTGAGTAADPRPLGNWLAIDVRQPARFNGRAVGAKISVKTGNRTLVKDIQVGGGHASGQLGFVHFGLGVAERANVRIKWPDGDWSHGYRVFANSHVVIERGTEKAKLWYPPGASNP
ncbi:CRTAC1 family protein [Roseibium denhamense]|uniref:Repeat domain-containing protein n=1 Tax=Roseibium denhamense TaxID=76305 RepID=A0ABY1PMX6_9HYPH|nr:CRTAC1 family protein [Roseibium denhamense]MTI07037.1 CRTAC1 family protein [Roseibium denhamense]SMP36543.1 Repeat domain-containing protein [Roseibium denhamense]